MHEFHCGCVMVDIRVLEEISKSRKVFSTPVKCILRQANIGNVIFLSIISIQTITVTEFMMESNVCLEILN
jgi:hypothetical protein